MRGLVLLLAVAVPVVIASPRLKHLTTEAKACHDLLDPFETRETEKATMDKCILEQTGLQAIIDELKSAAVTTHDHGHCHDDHDHGHGEGGRMGSPIDLLQKANKTAELTELNQCIARVNGRLLVASDGTASFDVTKFKGEVTTKVAGTTSQANTKLGLDNCPTTDLVAYNVHDFMECVESYCATGAAPAAESA